MEPPLQGLELIIKIYSLLCYLMSLG